MNNIVILPLFLPLLFGVSLFFFRHKHRLQQWIAVAGVLATLAVSLYLVQIIATDGIQVLHLGGWTAPYGIPLVADMLAVLLTSAASIVTLACLLYAFHTIGEGRKSHYAYPLILILLCGVNGSFLTGDIFNLFVFFEVMLLSSYILLSLGGDKIQLRETIKYVVINVISSSLFVIAIAYLYSITGTLNMADIALRVAEAGQDGLTTTICLMLLTVFGLKAGLFLFYWLPGSYSVPSAAISALFAALLTKVGIYAILRISTLIFYHQPEVTHTIMMWLAALTMILGSLGAIAYWSIRNILAYNVVISVGFIIFGVSMATEASLRGAVYYLIHDIFAKAMIYILGGTIISIAGTDKLRDISGLMRFRPMLGWLFLISALALGGVPPLSGFIGKILILQGGIDRGFIVICIIAILSSLLSLYSVVKVFIHSFWGEKLMISGEEKSSGKGYLLPSVLLAVFVIGLGLGAEWVMVYVDHAVNALINPSVYIDAVFS